MTELGPKTRLPTRLPDVKTPSWAGEEPRRHVSAAELAHARSTGALPKKAPHHQRHRGGTIRKRTHFFVFCSRLFFPYAGGDTGTSCRRGGACLARLLQCDATQKRDSVPLLFFFYFLFSCRKRQETRSAGVVSEAGTWLVSLLRSSLRAPAKDAALPARPLLRS